MLRLELYHLQSQPQLPFWLRPLASNLNDHPHLLVTRMNPWKPGFFRWNNTANLHQFQRTIASCLWQYFSKTKLPFGGDFIIKDRTGEFILQPGTNSWLPSDSSSSLSIPRSMPMTDSKGFPRRLLSMPTTTNSGPSCWNYLTWMMLPVWTTT